MLKRCGFNVLAMEVRLLGIKTLEWFVNSGKGSKLKMIGGVIEMKPRKGTVIIRSLVLEHFLKR